MSIAEKLTTIAENEQKVYEAGKAKECDTFWDVYQRNGSRTNYTYAFYGYGWYDDIYNPKYTIKPVQGNAVYGLSYITDTKVPIDLTAIGTNSQVFAYATRLVTINKVIFAADVSVSSSCFNSCNSLKNITVEGEIGRSISLQFSPLTVASMKNIIEHLVNYAGTDSEETYTVKFSEDCWTALEASGTSPNGGTWKDYVELTLGWLT